MKVKGSLTDFVKICTECKTNWSVVNAQKNV